MNFSNATSTPNLQEFDPTIIPMQYEVINDIRANYDYSQGIHEIMLSGSVGSSKSILMAHILVTHCHLFDKARVMLGRQSMPDLKDTLVAKILEHLDGVLIEGEDYDYNIQKASFEYLNGSQMISRSWGDKKFRKFRSLELSAAGLEEITENESQDWETAYKEIKARVGRLPHIPESFIIGATNPDAPSHSAYEYFINTNIATRHVYYSKTRDNPFLSPNYIRQLEETYTAQEIRRMLLGEWIEIRSEMIYYAFDEELSGIDKYTVDQNGEIVFCFDFNIGNGKPMSMCAYQPVTNKEKEIDRFFFKEVVVHTMDTGMCMDEMAALGLFDHKCRMTVRGDCNGKNRDTRNYNKTDYQIINKFMSNYRRPDGSPLEFIIDVPVQNPRIRERHIIVNGQLKNSLGKTHIYIVKDSCPVLIKGLRLTKLKKGANYIEDDSVEWQHVTTALGYGVVRGVKNASVGIRTSYGRGY